MCSVCVQSSKAIISRVRSNHTAHIHRLENGTPTTRIVIQSNGTHRPTSTIHRCYTRTAHIRDGTQIKRMAHTNTAHPIVHTHRCSVKDRAEDAHPLTEHPCPYEGSNTRLARRKGVSAGFEPLRAIPGSLNLLFLSSMPIASMSSSLSPHVPSKRSAFSRTRSALLDLGMTDVPRCTAHFKTICAGDFLCFTARYLTISVSRHESDVVAMLSST